MRTGERVEVTVGRRARPDERVTTQGLTLFEVFPKVEHAIVRDDAVTTGKALRALGFKVRWELIELNPDAGPDDPPTRGTRIVEPSPGMVVLSVLGPNGMDVNIPDGRIQARVQNGWVALEGHVDYDFQRREIKRMVRHVRGVVGITDDLVLTPPVSPFEVESKIQDAFEREAGVDARQVSVEVSDHTARLYGHVHSPAGGRRGQSRRRGRSGRRSGGELPDRPSVSTNRRTLPTRWPSGTLRRRRPA